jgi:DNA ligase-1
VGFCIDEISEDFSKMEAIKGRTELAGVLGNLFLRCEEEEIAPLVYVVQGQLSPPFRGEPMGMASRLLIRALSEVKTQKPFSDLTPEEAKKMEKSLDVMLAHLGDPGALAQEVLSQNGPSKLLFLDVFRVLERLSQMEGEGSQVDKVSELATLLSRLSPLSARFVARFVMGKLRLGVGDSTIIEALAVSGGGRNTKAIVEKAYNLCSDLGLVGKKIKQGGLESLSSLEPNPGFPIRVALCERLSSGEEIIAKIGRCSIESKYDGFRCQIHIISGKVEIFSRNLDSMTSMFPEIVRATKEIFGNRSAIFEGEALGIDPETGTYQPFQVTITRKRKHNVLEKSMEIPLRLLVFDLLYLDGVSWMERPFIERRAEVELLFGGERFDVLEVERPPMGVIGSSRLIFTDEASKVNEFFEEVIEEGFEGIIAKRLDGIYTAGSRNFNWIKLKKSYQGKISDTLDLVIIGYYLGKGQRLKLGIGAILAAVWDRESKSFPSIARIGSGLTEEKWMMLSEMLREIVVPERPVDVMSDVVPDFWVLPRFVVTVRADEISRSSMHACGRDDLSNTGGPLEGYALRFPRMVSFVRADKKPEDATEVSEIVSLFDLQRSLSQRSPREKPSSARK